MKLKLFLGLIITFSLVITLVSAVNLPFNVNSFAQGLDFSSVVLNHNAVNENRFVVEIRNVQFNEQVESTNQIQRYDVTFDVVNLLDRGIEDISIRTTLGVGQNVQKRVKHYNSLIETAWSLEPGEVRHEEVSFEIGPCDSGLKELTFYISNTRYSLVRGEIDIDYLGVISRESYDINIVASDECDVQQFNGVRIENVQLNQNIESSNVPGVFTIDFDVHNTLNVPVQDVAVTGVYGSGIADNLLRTIYFSPVIDENAVPLVAGETRHKQMTFVVSPCSEGVNHLVLSLKELTIDAQRHLVIDNEVIQEMTYDINIVHAGICREDNGVSDDLPVDNVDILEELESRYRSYKDNFDLQSDEYENAESLSDKNKAERDLERLDQKLSELEDDIHSLKTKHDDSIEDRLERLESKVEELREIIYNLLNIEETIDDSQEPGSVDLGVSAPVVVEDYEPIPSGLTVKSLDWNGFGYWALLIVGILIALGSIIWLLSFIFNY